MTRWIPIQQNLMAGNGFLPGNRWPRCKHWNAGWGPKNGVDRIGSAYSGTVAAFMNGIFPNFQPVGGTVVEVTIDLANDRPWLGCWLEPG